MTECFDISAFWPSGRSINSVFQEYGARFKLNRDNLTKASRGELTRASPPVVKGLLQLAAEFSGKPITLDEICTAKEQAQEDNDEWHSVD